MTVPEQDTDPEAWRASACPAGTLPYAPAMVADSEPVSAEGSRTAVLDTRAIEGQADVTPVMGWAETVVAADGWPTGVTVTLAEYVTPGINPVTVMVGLPTGPPLGLPTWVTAWLLFAMFVTAKVNSVLTLP
jgi:hypothetical protein